MSEYDTPRLTCQPSNAACYHTKECRKIKHKSGPFRTASKALIEWHDLEECEYCAGTFEPNRTGRGATS